MKVLKEGAIILTKSEAKKIILVRDGCVHTFYNPSIGLIGADHDVQDLLADIDSAKELQFAGEQAQKMNHALAIFKHLPIAHTEILFVETNPIEVNKLLKKLGELK